MNRTVSHKALKDLLETLLGRDVTVADGTGAHVGGYPTSTAVYVDDKRQRVALLCVDLPLGAAMAAALGMAPGSAAEQATEKGYLPPELEENLTEVANVVSSLLNGPEDDHTRLAAVYHPGHGMPYDVDLQRYAVGRRVDVRASVRGYGAGQLSLIRL